MTRIKSAEEVEEEHLRAFGPTLGPLYHALDNEVTWLHMKWLEYRKLYAHSEEQIDFLNATAGFFFGVFQGVVWKDILLHISRLTDPMETGPSWNRKENLVLGRLPDAVSDPDLSDKLQSLIETAKDQSKFARDWRNRHIAHSALSLAIDSGAKPLEAASRQGVEEVLRSFRRIMNLLSVSYLDTERGYEYPIVRDDADTLIYHLRVAVRFEEYARQLHEEGKLLSEDLERLLMG